MLARRLVPVIAICAVLMPLAAHAYVGGPEPFIHDWQWRDLPDVYPNAYLGTPQTALKAGDTAHLYVRVFDSLSPGISADFSVLGGALESATGTWLGYDPPLDTAISEITFSSPPVPASTPDGVLAIPLSAIDAEGRTASTTATIMVDNAPPTVSLSSLAFPGGPADLTHFTVTGHADGTGTALHAGKLALQLYDASGAPLDTGFSSVPHDADLAALNAAFASTTDGSFSLPLTYFGIPATTDPSTAASLRFTILVYDEAGNIATTSITAPIPQVPATTTPAVDSVLVLPGIEGSRLYEGTDCGATSEEKLWEPYASIWGVVRGAGDKKVKKLALDASGESVCGDIYTKEGDILDAVAGTEYYRPLIDELNALKASGTINNWQAAAYDWRLSLDDLLSAGKQEGNAINYSEATTTPYIEQTLENLAAGSQTGKVTIIAHSNGGLVAKALMERLEAEGKSNLVDRIVMVAVPQTGAPLDLGSLLVGMNAGIYKDLVPIVSNAAARTFALNSPMAYHLLPSEDYLESTAVDPNHAVASFNGSAWASDEAAYGPAIHNVSDLDSFILGEGDGRAQADTDDLSSLALGNANLVAYANRIHAALDSWTPPPGVEVDQIAGWGVDSTIAGVEFYTSAKTLVTGPIFSTKQFPSYRPVPTEDGDGTVPVPSALAMGESAHVKRYWLNLESLFNDSGVLYKHPTIFGAQPLRDFIQNLITSATSTLPAYITATSPSPNSADKQLIYILHSPLTLALTNASGATTGLHPDGTVSQDIPGASYGQFGETQYIIAPAGQSYTLAMHGLASGTFSLDIEEATAGTVTATSTIANVPVATSTTASLTTAGSISATSTLTVDEDGNGQVDFSLAPQVGTTTSFETTVEPLAYVAYMHSAIAAFDLDKQIEKQLNIKLKNVEHLIKKDGVWEKGDDDGPDDSPKGARLDERVARKLDKLEAYVHKQADKNEKAQNKKHGNTQKGIPEDDAAQIIDMINLLKTLTL